MSLHTLFDSFPPAKNQCFDGGYKNTYHNYSLRTEFLSELVESNKLSIHRHSFTAARFGGIGFSKARYMREGAFLGCLKNLLYEFKLRYPLLWSNEDLIRYWPCHLLISLQNLIDGMNPDV
ncbi:hypothetical protein GEMRC1_005898 [Eukaryota sp. GEM-RC1]